MKKVVYHEPVTNGQLSAPATLERMLTDKRKLVKAWGKEKYAERLKSLIDYIREMYG